MKEKINKPGREDIFDELRRLMKNSPLSTKALEKFNIFSILIGVISFFVYSLIFGSIGLVLGIIAKKDRQKGAVFGIILGTLSISLVLTYWIVKDISASNYEFLITAIIFTIISVAMKLAGFFDRKIASNGVR